ncbi:MAG TPA: hypothetical protein VN598_03925 [Usitatibacter sp.]|nr:hypothetical protein [Usitatibacter sp.]
MSETRPGRTCPLSYRYPPASLDRAPEVVADTIYIVGGLYGNVESLDAVQEAAASEPGARLVFNGDFHWFDVAPGDFARIEAGVSAHPALRGNVETEIAGEDSGAGCGCAYPADVSDAEVHRSNEILARLRETAREAPGVRERLAALPMNLVARVGDARVAIVHGDAASLAGWGFAQDRLDDGAHRRWIESAFRDACVDVFASTHTCLPALRQFAGSGVVANNGAAGMPNFAGRRMGLMTRVSVRPYEGTRRVAGLASAGCHVDLIDIPYDAQAFARRFLASWPPGSAAHDSYWRRIAEGPRFEARQAFPRAA